MRKFSLFALAGLILGLGFGAARAAEPEYEIVVANGTLTKVDMGKKVTLTPDEGGKAGKQITLDVTSDTLFVEASADKKGPTMKAIKSTDLQAAQKQAVAVVYAKVGDATHLLALAAADPKGPKGFVVGSVKGVLGKIDGEKTITVQPFLEGGKFGKQEDVAVLSGSKFFEMAPKEKAKPPFEFKAAKLADLTAKRQAVAMVFARWDGNTAVLGLVAQPGKEK